MSLQIRQLTDQVQCVLLGHEQTPLLLIDDLVTETDWLCTQAQQVEYKTGVDNYYPGIRSVAPVEYQSALTLSLLPLVRRVFAPQARALRLLMSAYSIATTAPQALRPIQMLPHFDNTEPLQLAMVHYLCDEAHGGTSFYRHRQTSYERISASRLPTYAAVLKQQAMAARLHQNPGYIQGSTDLFERIYQVSARMNRAVIYPGNLLHSGDIQAVAGLSADPAQGRLTISSFLQLS